MIPARGAIRRGFAVEQPSARLCRTDPFRGILGSASITLPQVSIIRRFNPENQARSPRKDTATNAGKRVTILGLQRYPALYPRAPTLKSRLHSYDALA